MSSCTICWNNLQQKFYPGNILAGTVICKFSNAKSIREIRLKIKGKEKTKWGSGKHERWGKNKFLRVILKLSGEGDYSAGQHQYPFSYQLPMVLPSTYKNGYGYIEYSVKAIVDRPFKIDYKDKKEIFVVSPIDLRSVTDFSMERPVYFSVDRTFDCFCCRSGIITMEVSLDKAVFTQNEGVKSKVTIKNNSDETVLRVDAKLKMIVKCKATNPCKDTRKEKVDLVCETDSGMHANSEKTYDFCLKVPDLILIPNFNTCNLFEKKIVLKVKAFLSNWLVNLEESIPITIGHIFTAPLPPPEANTSVPLTIFTLNSLAQSPYVPNSQPVMMPQAYSANAENEVLPPSYVEAVKTRGVWNSRDY